MFLFTGVMIFITLLIIIVYYLQQRVEEEDYGERKFSSLSQPYCRCRCFSLTEIKSATHNFDEHLVIGKGGFGKVYKGIIDGGASTVAIKRLDFGSNQGAPEFWTEIDMLSNLRHSHLVALIGYCNDPHEMIIVYEYIPSGSLEDNLYKIGRSNGQNRSSLSWVQRLKICLGAARGLDYLHTGTSTEHRVIHRDVKSSNILLDENMEAKISDFGLSKIGPINQPCTHVSTHVKGTFGYLDPEYFLTHRLTKESDVYAFGVVLFEVLCGRPAVDSRLDEEQWGLAGWAKTCVKEGKIGLIVDPSLNGSILSNCLDVFSKTACECLRKSSKRRPSMAEVVTKLEFVLAMQEMPDTSLLEDEIIRPLGSYDNREIADSFTGQGISAPDSGTDTSGEQDVVNGSITGSSFGQIDSFWRPEGPSRAWSHARPAKKRTFVKRVHTFFSSKFHSTIDLDGLEFAQLDFDTVKTAADNFAQSNKLGEGEFGPVFKGRLPNGQEIAVKMFSANSTQGKSVLKNEVMLLEKVRHKNLVRLLGLCVKGKEKLLIYEFMQNGSLDLFLSDAVKHQYLNWDSRYKIVKGVARGLLYLHNEALFQISHCNIKPGKILLDAEFNPKISDFGLGLLQKERLSENSDIIWYKIPGARYRPYRPSEASTLWNSSVRSDVYGFGILLLEVIRGQKMSHLVGDKNSNTFLHNAWRNWGKGTPLNFADLALRDSPNDGGEVVRCIHIGLLCIQKDVVDRPSMGTVLLMLSSPSTSLPEPSEPAFLTREMEMFKWNKTRIWADYSRIGQDSITDMTQTQIHWPTARRRYINKIHT